ncbi:MAG: hypothetical protein PUB10_01260 [Clostridiales bacterium]|nr:hypothetical protein [Clostridiales bacterium]
MRKMDFKMERTGLVEIGDRVEVTEGVLPSAYYYTVEPAVAMSGNIPFRDRLTATEGIVTDIQENQKGFYITVEFE